MNGGIVAAAMTNKRMFLKRCVAYEIEMSFISRSEDVVLYQSNNDEQ